MPSAPTKRSHRALIKVAFIFAALGSTGSNPALAQDVSTDVDSTDPLANIVVTGTSAPIPLPRLALVPSLSAAMDDVTLRSVVRHDLDLSGEFDLASDSDAPPASYLADAPIDIKAWRAKGIEDLVRVGAKKINAKTVELHAQAFLVSAGPTALYDKRFRVPVTDVRVESHRVADLLIGAFTGQNGSFASHMTFVSSAGTARRVYTIDADGFDALAVSPEDRVALAPTFGPGGDLYYSASDSDPVYKVYTQHSGPLEMNVAGSVYGIDFSPDFQQVAVALGQVDKVHMFLGPSLTELRQVSDIGFALRPGFTPSGKLAFAGSGKFGQRIYVDGRPISPDGLFASSPTFCRNPNGIMAVFAIGVGKRADLVATSVNGGSLVRLTQGMGSNSYPACSPDGRLIAFFSTRNSGDGPGLYVMRASGGRARRIASLLGDSLRWAALPPSKSIDVKDPPPSKRVSPAL